MCKYFECVKYVNNTRNIYEIKDCVITEINYRNFSKSNYRKKKYFRKIFF